MKVDVVVVGARVAGAAVAMLLARAGARVLVVDRGAYGTDTVSTHALMRGGVLQLHRWGILPAIVAAGTPAVRSTTFGYTNEDVRVDIEPKYGVEALYAPRRVLLDGILSAAASESGAEVAYGVRMDDVVRDANGRVRGITASANGTHLQIDADLVIGADGMYSTVAKKVEADTLVHTHHATGTLYSYWDGIPADGYQWVFRAHGGVGAIPTNGGTCVFVSIPAPRFREEVHGNPTAAYRRLVREVSPAFADRLDSATQLEPVHGFGGLPGFIKRGSGMGWALAGDAGYFKDPLTAHGLTDALRDAELVARAALVGTDAAFAEYEATRLSLSQRLLEVTDDVASFTWTDATLQNLHREFSREMSREVKFLASLEPLSCPLPSASALHAVSH